MASHRVRAQRHAIGLVGAYSVYRWKNHKVASRVPSDGRECGQAT